MTRSSPNEKKVSHAKFKRLRNRVNSELKKDMRAHNNARVDNAKDENEIWKIVNEISNPRSGEGITIIENNIFIIIIISTLTGGMVEWSLHSL